MYNLATITHWHFCQVSTAWGFHQSPAQDQKNANHLPSNHRNPKTVMIMAAEKWSCLQSRPVLEAPTSICLSFAAKHLTPQKMKLCRREVPSPQTAVRHSSSGLAPKPCVLPCPLVTFTQNLTEIPRDLRGSSAALQLQEVHLDLWHPDIKNCWPWGPALNCNRTNRL